MRRMRRMPLALLALLALALAACATQNGAKCREPIRPGMLPAFPLQALRSSHAKRAKLYFDSQGRLAKVTVYVARKALPNWVLAVADKALGKGEDLEYEVEQYRNGDQTYEVTRKVGDKTVELSLDAKTKQKRYLEHKDLTLDKLPPALLKVIEKLEGFTPQHYSRKDRKKDRVHEIYGTKGGKPFDVYLADDGVVLRKRRPLKAIVKVDI